MPLNIKPETIIILFCRTAQLRREGRNRHLSKEQAEGIYRHLPEMWFLLRKLYTTRTTIMTSQFVLAAAGRNQRQTNKQQHQ